MGEDPGRGLLCDCEISPHLRLNLYSGQCYPWFPGHGVHCSLLHHHGEKFSSELLYSALCLARHRHYSHDIIECQTRDRSFASIFGVAWGIIPEVRTVWTR